MKEFFGRKILKYQDQIFRDLKTLVAIPSVADASAPRRPFGERSAEALRWILNRARELGLDTVNVDDYAGHAEYGGEKAVAAVVTHVDVVPAGEGWTGDPYVLEKRDGRLYGRGTADDKGAAVVALYCLKALKDEKVKCVRKARAIFGAGEEIASDDLKQYFQREVLPELAFTPDAEYGVCNREKGILHVELSAPADGSRLGSLHGGTVRNAVAASARAEARCTAEECQALEALSKKMDGKFSFQWSDGVLTAECVGRAAHAMEPQKGRNAAARLVRLFSSCFGGEALGALWSFVDQKIGLELDGSSLGLRREDAVSGPLTVNLGVAEQDNGVCRAVLDIRYPVTADGEEIFERLRAAAGAYGVKAQVLAEQKPLFVPEDTPLIRMLKGAYETVTGGQARLYGTGGGTYARSLQNRGVAFGPVFPGEENHLHDADEFIEIEKFMLHAQICLEALFRMATQK